MGTTGLESKFGSTEEFIVRLKEFAEGKLSGQQFYNFSDAQINSMADAARRNFESGRYEQARVIFEGLCEFVPSNQSYLISLGIIYFLENDLDKAIDSMSRAIGLGNKEGIVHLIRGESYYLLGKRELGLKDLVESCRLEASKESLVNKRATALVNVLGKIPAKAAPKKIKDR